ncbi:MAG: OmpA family protein [Phycisphaerae bacterium]|nr:OmpA family protein [Phycisphaerae bacterium]
MRFTIVLAGAVLAAATLVGCNNKDKDEIAMLKDKNSELQSELDRTRTALDGSESSRRALEEDLTRARAEASYAPQAGTSTPTGGNTPQLPTDLPPGVTARVEGTTVILDIPGEVLFDSGKATLRTDAKKTLDAVAKSVKNAYPGKRLSVEGFTDTDPIKKSKWADNWELAYERARAVGKYLSTKGFSENQFRYVSYGPSEPRSSKKESRRVELAIVEAGS